MTMISGGTDVGTRLSLRGIWVESATWAQVSKWGNSKPSRSTPARTSLMKNLDSDTCVIVFYGVPSGK